MNFNKNAYKYVFQSLILIGHDSSLIDVVFLHLFLYFLYFQVFLLQFEKW